MKYIKLFEFKTEYDNYTTSSDFVTPNVSFVTETGYISYSPSKKDNDIPEGYIQLFDVNGTALCDSESKKLLAYV